MSANRGRRASLKKLHGIGGNRRQRVHSAAHINRFEIDSILGKNPILMTDRNHTRVHRDRTQGDADYFTRLRISNSASRKKKQRKRKKY